MPKAFNSCVNGGGRVRTIKPNGGTYIHICYKGGKSYSGELKHDKPNRTIHKKHTIPK